jgi:hypothetical protein
MVIIPALATMLHSGDYVSSYKGKMVHVHKLILQGIVQQFAQSNRQSFSLQWKNQFCIRLDVAGLPKEVGVGSQQQRRLAVKKRLSGPEEKYKLEVQLSVSVLYVFYMEVAARSPVAGSSPDLWGQVHCRSG